MGLTTSRPCRGRFARSKPEGWVEIAITEGDQRRRMVWLTEKGARQLAASLAAWRRANAELDKIVPPELARRLAVETERL